MSIKVKVRWEMQTFTVSIANEATRADPSNRLQAIELLASTPLSSFIHLCSKETGVLPQDIRIWKEGEFLNDLDRSLQHYDMDHGTSVLMVTSQRDRGATYPSQAIVRDILNKSDRVLKPLLQEHEDAVQLFINGYTNDAGMATSSSCETLEARINQFVEQLELVQTTSEEGCECRKAAIQIMRDRVDQIQKTQQLVRDLERALGHAQAIHERAQTKLISLAQSHIVKCQEFLNGAAEDIDLEDLKDSLRELQHSVSAIVRGMALIFRDLDTIRDFPRPTKSGRQSHGPVTKLCQSIINELQEWHYKARDAFAQVWELVEVRKILAYQESAYTPLIPKLNDFMNESQQFIDGIAPNPPSEEYRTSLRESFDQVIRQIQLHTAQTLSIPRFQCDCDARKAELLFKVQGDLQCLMNADLRVNETTQAISAIGDILNASIANVFPLAEEFISAVKACVEQGTPAKESSHPTSTTPAHLMQRFLVVDGLLTQEITKLENITSPTPSPGREIFGPVYLKRRSAIDALLEKSNEVKQWEGVLVKFQEHFESGISDHVKLHMESAGEQA